MGNKLPSPINPSNFDIYHRLGQIEGKLDQHLDLNLPKRVSSLERSRAWIMGVGAICAAGIAALFRGSA